MVRCGKVHNIINFIQQVLDIPFNTIEPVERMKFRVCSVNGTYRSYFRVKNADVRTLQLWESLLEETLGVSSFVSPKLELHLYLYDNIYNRGFVCECSDEFTIAEKCGIGNDHEGKNRFDCVLVEVIFNLKSGIFRIRGMKSENCVNKLMSFLHNQVVPLLRQ